jgi:hypothetical protein
MIRAMLWKEYREHRAVWLTLGVVSVAGLFGLMRLMAPSGVEGDPEARLSLEIVAVFLAWTYGLVCGSMMLAGERESATLTFLDILPARRIQLWLLKWLIGLVLLGAQVVLLAGFVMGLGIAPSVLEATLTLLAMLLSGWIGYSWGLLASAYTESVLNAIGVAILGQIAVSVVVSGLVFVANGLIAMSRGTLELAIVVLTVPAVAALFLGPIAGSARLFSQMDRLRRQAAKGESEPRVRLGASWPRLIWLCYSQMRRLILGLSVFAFGLGFLVPVAGPVAWPAATLFFGVLCGVTICADEQAHGSFRFLGDQRFPLDRIWFVKVGMRFALAVFASCLLMLPSLAIVLYHRVEDGPSQLDRSIPLFSLVLHSVLVGEVIPTKIHLTVWLLYGFSVGHLSGLLFRKSLVAAVFALGGSVLFVSVWVPSMVGMGLHFWQIAGVPLILLATAWLLVPAWVADRLVARGTFLCLGAALAAAGLWTVGGLWYRVAEVPDVPDQFDMPSFVANIPKLEDNPAGLAIRGAWNDVERVTKAFDQRQFAIQQLPGNGGQDAPRAFVPSPSELLQNGWPDGPSDVGDWLDNQLKNPKWLSQLAEAAVQPLGMVEDASKLTVNSSFRNWHHVRSLSLILALRGLQLQARGHPEHFVEYLRISLALSRNIQSRSPTMVAFAGRSLDMTWNTAIERWLEKLHEEPRDRRLLQSVRTILAQHDAELPDESDQIKADYLLALNTLKEMPETILAMNVPQHRDLDPQLRQAETKVAAILWLFPWEQERHDRILRAVFQGDPVQRLQAREQGFALSSLGGRADIRLRPKRQLAALRASQLKVALRQYQAKTGQPANSLDQLVPQYLTAIPLDPFDGKPFRYRLSRGERLEWGELPMPATLVPMPFDPAGAEELPPPQEDAPEPPLPGAGGPMQGGLPGILEVKQFRTVPLGQGILWSVGEDGRDDGGLRNGTEQRASRFGEDILYLVPLPAK